MKNVFRFLIPIVILAVLALSTTGLVFAHEFTFFQSTVKNRELTGIVNAASSKNITASGTKPTARNLIKASDQTTSSSQLPDAQVASVENPGRNVEGFLAPSSPITNTIEFTGTLEAMSAASVTVSGQVLALTPETEMDEHLAVGMTVKVHAFVNADGSLTAREIELYHAPSPIHDTIEFTGTLEAMSAASVTVSGQVLALTPETEMDEHLAVGMTVKVHAFVNADGSLTAREIELYHAPSPIHDTIEFTGTLEAMSAASVTVSGQVLALTPETEMDEHLAVGMTVKVHAFVNADGSLTAREIELYHAPSPIHDTIEFTGTLEAMSAASVTVSGQVLALTPETEMDEHLAVGMTVKVHAFVNADGSLTAREIELYHASEDEDMSGDDHGQGDDQGQSDDQGQGGDIHEQGEDDQGQGGDIHEQGGDDHSSGGDEQNNGGGEHDGGSGGHDGGGGGEHSGEHGGDD